MWFFDVFLIVNLKKLWEKQSSGRWFERPWPSCNVSVMLRLLAFNTADQLVVYHDDIHINFMMTSSSGNIFRDIGPLCGEFTGYRWIPLTKASDAELWCFLWSAPWIIGWVNNREACDLRRHRANYDVIVMLQRPFRQNSILFREP